MQSATATTGMIELAGRALADLHRSGDPTAFDEVYRRYADMVFGIALRMSGNPSTAEDLSQEIFLRIHRHLGKFGGRSSLKTWVYQVSLNACRSGLARRARHRDRQVREAEEKIALVPDEGPSPERTAMGRERLRHLEAALLDLPRPFREAVVLCDVEGLAYDEIAEILGVRIGTVRSRIARGRDRLRRALEENE